jgi:thymidine phosphorylase
MHIEDLLRSMRAQEVQSDEAIQAFIDGLTSGRISRPQAAAWLAWAFTRTLTDGETLALTRAMTRSGTVMTWPDGPTLVDKHSTGGVGDKVSLVLAPLWAELGLRVPMISGRGLGHTGGTLDKLEAIPGFRTDLSDDELTRVLADVGCFISGQTGTLAPADRTLYALRNEVQCVESIPLIVGSILSKKLAEGVRRLVLDVKCGSGAFMETRSDAVALARALTRVAAGAGVDVVAHVTAMERPLGRTIGNALEVEEAVATLQGEGPADLVALTVALAEHPQAAEVLASGAAYERFVRMVEAQGGDPRSLSGGLRGSGTSQERVLAPRGGFLASCDARAMGVAAFRLGAGRRRAEDPVDHGVGLRLHADVGDAVSEGEPLVTLVHRDGRALDEARDLVREALRIEDAPPQVPALLQARVEPDPALV